MRFLIVNADDYGYSAVFNKGIVEGVHANRITSVTVLVNHPFVGKSLIDHQGVGVGLHFELKEGEDCRKALLSQLDKFEKIFGRKPDHIDGHKGAYAKPENRKVVIEIALELELPLRSGNEEQRNEFRNAGVKTIDHFVSSLDKSPVQVLEELRKIPSGVTEWMVHPGYFDPNCKSSLNKEREKELGITLSKEFQDLLKEEKIKLVNYDFVANR